jgi:hypothetical protein
MAQGLGGYAQTKILRDVHVMPIPGYSRKNTFVETCQNMKTQGPSRKRNIYRGILGPYSSTITVLQMSLTHGSDPVARTTGETCNRGVGSTVSHRLL